MTLDFTKLTAAQQHLVEALYQQRGQGEAVSDTASARTYRSLRLAGWIVTTPAICLTPAGIKAYEYWQAWGSPVKVVDSDESAVYRGGRKIKLRFLRKLEAIQREVTRERMRQEGVGR